MKRQWASKIPIPGNLIIFTQTSTVTKYISPANTYVPIYFILLERLLKEEKGCCQKVQMLAASKLRYNLED